MSIELEKKILEDRVKPVAPVVDEDDRLSTFIEMVETMVSKEEILVLLRSKRTTLPAEDCIKLIMLYRCFCPLKEVLGVPKITSLVKRYDHTSSSTFCRTMWKITSLLEQRQGSAAISSKLAAIYSAFEGDLTLMQRLVIAAFLCRSIEGKAGISHHHYFTNEYQNLSRKAGSPQGDYLQILPSPRA